MVSCFIEARVESGLEELIVGNLVDDKGNGRYVKIIPIQLLEKDNTYDSKKLVEIALKEGQQNKLGYLADVALELADIHELKGIEDKKEAFFREHDEKKYKDKDKLRRKWKIITDLTSEELDDYMDIYITRKNPVKDYVPPNFNLADY
ncbi:hypothetical protein J4454_03000 [Candidatus Pacearchaeota archaeon]|nr:hypothetical protein [Candidatus Pacearchaeota archaeon]